MTAYRYTLTRRLTAEPRRWLGVVMLNPSVAESDYAGPESDDNTIKSIRRIAEYNEFDGFLVANLSPWRTTDPDDLIKAVESGEDIFDRSKNDDVLVRLAKGCEVVACAWGANPLKHPALDRRAGEVRALLLGTKPVVHCFGKTKEGWPRHPCRLPRATRLQVFAQRDGR